MADFPEPQDGRTDPAELFCVYLDYFRQTVVDRLTALPVASLRTSTLPSGWTPLELVSHLVHMERRWLVWGFLGEVVDDPWGDNGPDGRWEVDASQTLPALAAQLRAVGDRTTRIIRQARLADRARVGGRFTDAPPTLERICFHVLQEYARHVGHLDVVRELTDGAVGE